MIRIITELWTLKVLSWPLRLTLPPDEPILSGTIYTNPESEPERSPLMSNRKYCAVTLLSCMLFLVLGISGSVAQTDAGDTNPLQPFERLIGGDWYLENSYQTFTWGIGKKSVHGKSFAEIEGEYRLVGEGFWFYHPGEKSIRGYFTGVGMGIDLFEYVTRWEGDVMKSDLEAYGKVEGSFEEEWVFTGKDTFVWALYQTKADNRMKVMGGTYERK